MTRRPLIFATLLLWLALAGAGAAIEVRQTLWGFDGRVVPGRMMPFSVLVANPGRTPFDGELVLRQTGGLDSPAGAPFVQQVYLAPGSERWVQFYVFASQQRYGVELSWLRGRERARFDAPPVGAPARVILSEAENPFATGGALKLFPDSLFPTTVAATDGLDAVVLDYTPRWEPARREAFVDWLKRGGVVLVLPGAGGGFPVFTEALEVLNITGDSARVGSGTVLRATATRRDALEGIFASRGFPAPELKSDNQGATIYNLEQSLFQRLAQLTRPDLQWGLLYTLTGVYLLVIGPLHYRWGRRIDYRVSILAFLGTVAVFGWIFSMVGRRGYGESQTVHSLSIARALGGGRHDVTQWISAFATRGDIYPLTHDAPANLYAAVSDEAVNGRILNGKDGHFLADIPLYSSRQFVHRAAMVGDDTSVTVEAWETGELGFKELVLKVGPHFPKDVLEIRAHFRDGFFELKREGDRVVLAPGARRLTFEEFLPKGGVQVATNFSGNYMVPDPDPAVDAEAGLVSALPLLYARAMDGQEYFPQAITRRTLPDDVLALYVFAKAPEGFRMRSQGFDRESGCVLYVEVVENSKSNGGENSKSEIRNPK